MNEGNRPLSPILQVVLGTRYNWQNLWGYVDAWRRADIRTWTHHAPAEIPEVFALYFYY